jgi:hypothetical protein
MSSSSSSTRPAGSASADAPSSDLGNPFDNVHRHGILPGSTTSAMPPRFIPPGALGYSPSYVPPREGAPPQRVTNPTEYSLGQQLLMVQQQTYQAQNASAASLQQQRLVSTLPFYRDSVQSLMRLVTCNS